MFLTSPWVFLEDWGPFGPLRGALLCAAGPLCVQRPLAPSELCVQGPLHLLGASLHEGALCRDPPLQGSLCLQFAVPPLCTATPSVQPPPSEPLCRGPSLCTPPSHCVQGPPLCRSPSLCLLQDSLRFCKIPQDSPFGPLRGAVRRAWAPGPPLFFVFVFSYLPVPSRSLVPPLTERLKTLRPGEMPNMFVDVQTSMRAVSL